MFVCAISALWGWYVLGIWGCIIMLAFAFDRDGYIRKVRRHPMGLKAMTKGERIVFHYFLTLLVIAVIFNLVFVATYLFGVYAPPFGDIPFH